MQQEATKDVAKKVKDFFLLNEIAHKLDSEDYRTAFNEELRAEAIRQLDSGIMIDNPIQFQQEHIDHIKGYAKSLAPDPNGKIEIADPTNEAQQDFKYYQTALSNDFNIHEKISRNSEYAQAFQQGANQSEHKSLFDKIKDSLNFIDENSRIDHLTAFNEKYGKRFKPFIIDPIAKDDIERYEQSRDPYLAFEIIEKMKKADYAKSVEAIYQDLAEKRNMPVNGYVENKLNNLNEVVNSLNDTQRADFAERFNQAYPNGFKTTKEQETEQEQLTQARLKEAEQEIANAQKEFNTQLYDYLKTNQGNDNEQHKRVIYFQDKVNEDPENINKFGANFFTDGNIRANAPDDVKVKLDRIGNALDEQGKKNMQGASAFTQALQKKILTDTKALANNVKAGQYQVKAREQLNQYYSKQFKKEYGIAEKKLQIKRQKDQKIKVDKVKMSY